MSFQNELIITTSKILAHIRGGIEFIITSYIVFFAHKTCWSTFYCCKCWGSWFANTYYSQICTTHRTSNWSKCKNNYEDTALHAFEIFRTPKKVLKDTHVIEKPKLEPSTLVEHVDVSK